MSANESVGVRQWVLDTVTEATEPVPEGQTVQSPLWTSERRLASSGEKFSSPFPKAEVRAALTTLRAEGELFSWHGLVCPNDPVHLRAVIEAERASDCPRKILVGKANRALSGGADE